MENKIQLTERE